MIREIVIVGGGFGGARIAKRLARTMRNAHITVVDRELNHTFYPNLYEIATASVSEFYERMPATFYDLKSTVMYPFSDIFLYDVNITFLHEEVTRVDSDQHQIHFKSGGSHAYDVLVMGVGSETNYFGLSGMGNYAFSLKTASDALLIRNALDEVFYRSPKQHSISLVIGGGGFTGCELAGELALFVKDLCRAHAHPPELVTVTIIEASPTLLGPLDPWTQKKAYTRLTKLGVRCLFSSLITDVQEKSLTLKDGTVVNFDMLIWTAGVKGAEGGSTVPDTQMQKNACFIVDDYLRATPHENIFGVGDVTCYVDKISGKPLPMAASVAESQADYIADAIVRMEKKQSLVPYKAYRAGFVIPLGGKYAILDYHGFRMAGFIPWCVKQGIALYYWMGLIGVRRALQLWLKGIHAFVRNDRNTNV
jgi:NADH dehydrogenase